MWLELLFVHVPNMYTDSSYEAQWVGFAGYGAWFGPMDPQNILRSGLDARLGLNEHMVAVW